MLGTTSADDIAVLKQFYGSQEVYLWTRDGERTEGTVISITVFGVILDDIHMSRDALYTWGNISKMCVK